MDRLRTGVVGLGRIGWEVHLPEIKKHSDKFDLIAVVDPEKSRLAEARQDFGVENLYRENGKMLKSENLDLIVIASPTLFHTEQTNQAFAHGVDVFCDKPLAVSYEDAKSTIELMEQSGRKFMQYQPHRPAPVRTDDDQFHPERYRLPRPPAAPERRR